MKIEQVDRHCDLFEQRLRKGEKLSAEAFLEECHLPADSELMAELRRLEREYQNGKPAPAAEPDAQDSGGELPVTEAVPADGHPTIIGTYRLLQKIGEGGMGEVWVAKQSEPVKRRVALKLIKAGMDSKAVVQRFEHERQALALMDHPHIAKVLDGGITDEFRPYFVMELVNGLALTKFCDQAKLSIRERLELFIPICQAVQHAHQKGIVHRDLKPSNILVTLIDGRAVPKVIDFGVAKATGGKLTDQTMSTQFGAVVGTLEYMSPEQASFSGADVDTRADIYSLGVILYELLTGLKPFDGARLKQAAYDELIRIIWEEEPSKPSLRLSTDAALPSLAALRQIEPDRLKKLLKGELDWVVMKCLEKQRDRRYETVNALARDIQRYLADEPVEARPPSTGYRLRKLLRRNRGPVVAAGLVFLALVGGVVGTTLGLIEAKRQEKLAVSAKNNAQNQRKEAERQTKIAKEQTQVANAALKDVRTTTESIKQQLRIATAERLAALSYVKRSESLEVSLLLAVESGRATRKDEERVLASSHQALLDALGAIGGRRLAGHEGSIAHVAISSDHRWVVTGSSDMTARIWDLMAENPGMGSRVLKGHEGPIECVAISPNRHWVVTGSRDMTARIWDLMAEDPVMGSRALNGHEGPIECVAISPDSRWLITGSHDKTVRIWDLTATNPNTTSRILRGHEGPIECVAISLDGRWLATGSWDDTARIWDLTNVDPGASAFVLTGHDANVSSIAISPDSHWVVTGSQDRTARVWDLTAENPGSTSRVLSGHQFPIESVAISPDNRWIVTGSRDTRARIWDLQSDNPVATSRLLNGHQGPIVSVAISPDSRWVVTGSLDHTVRIWDLTAADPSAYPRVLSGHQRGITSIAVSSDGRSLVTGSWDATARVWRWQWDDLVELAGRVGRNFMRAEWERYFPGEPYSKTFPELPAGDDSATSFLMSLADAESLARAGDHSAAASKVHSLAANSQLSGGHYYLLARLLSLCAAAAEDANQAAAYADEAMDLLQRARKAGLFDDVTQLAEFEQDTEFAALRRRDDFQKFVGELHQNPQGLHELSAAVVSHAQREQWARVRLVLEQLSRRDPSNYNHRYQLAILYTYLDDEPALRALAVGIQNDFALQSEPIVCERLTRAFALAQDRVPELHVPSRWLESMHADPVLPSVEPWNQFTGALLDLAGRNTAAALLGLQRAEGLNPGSVVLEASCLLARSLALDATGRQAMAVEAYEQGLAVLQTKLRHQTVFNTADRLNDSRFRDWHEYVMARVLCRRAELRLFGREQTDNERAEFLIQRQIGLGTQMKSSSALGAALGESLARSGELATAVSEFARAFAMSPNNLQLGQILANLTCYSKDAEAYRVVCAQLMDHFGADKRRSLMLAWALMLAPEPIEDTHRLIDVAKNAVELTSGAAWSYTALAGAYLRNAKYDLALRSLDVADRLSGAWIARPLHDLLRAITLVHLNRIDEAREALAKGVQFCDGHLEPRQDAPFGDLSEGNWWDWYAFQVLRREAEELLRNVDSKSKQ
jgi:WD40 repeat protein/serine/threonine protein kinase